MRRGAAVLALHVALAFALIGCTQPSPAIHTTEWVHGTLNVFAAASLTDAFKDTGAAFTRIYPDVKVTFNFAGTPTLLTQLEQGASADVLASADQPNMQKAIDAGLVLGDPRVFTRNRLEIVVAAHNPKHVQGLADLARPDVLYITEATTVPAGRYSAQALAAAGVKANPRSFETDVKSVVTKVQLGEADAGIVYVTDVKAAGSRVAGIEIPDAQNVVATYPAAVVKGSKNAQGAEAFIAFLLSREGQALLQGFGFTAP